MDLDEFVNQKKKEEVKVVIESVKETGVNDRVARFYWLEDNRKLHIKNNKFIRRNLNKITNKKCECYYCANKKFIPDYNILEKNSELIKQEQDKRTT
jgi:hypothetical protein